jgi:hypothetical protein
MFLRYVNYLIIIHIVTQIIANQRLVIFEISIFINASSSFFLFNKAITDLNSGQEVKVASTKNHISHLGAREFSAVKLTIGSKKYQLNNKIINQSGKYNLDSFSSFSSFISSESYFFINKYILQISEASIQ